LAVKLTLAKQEPSTHDKTLCKAILRALKESKSGFIGHSAMLRKKGIGIHDQRMVKSAYDRLYEMGDIERPHTINGGLRITLKGVGESMP
jgi:glycine cleavage system aminomethyltransferase T